MRIMKMVRELNDDGLEILILFCRLFSFAALLGAIVIIVQAVGDASLREGATGTVLLTVAIVAGSWGWWWMGNADWTTAGRRPRSVVRVCTAQWHELRCNAALDEHGKHAGPHHDTMRDPSGEKLWW